MPVGEPQDEVAVDPLARPDRDAAVGVRDRVQARAHGAELQPRRVDVDLDRQPHRVGEPGQQHRRRDPARVGHLIGVGHRAVADARARQRASRDVARRHDEGEPVRRLAVLVGQRSGQPERDRHPLAGHDVPDPHREHVGPLLLGDRSAPSLLDRLLVLGAGLRALLQHAFDDAAVGLHPHLGDRCAVGEGEDVGGLQRHVERVDELLRQLGAGDQPGDGGSDVEPVERQVAALGAQRAEAGVFNGGGRGIGQQGNLRHRGHVPSGSGSVVFKRCEQRRGGRAQRGGIEVGGRPFSAAASRRARAGWR